MLTQTSRGDLYNPKYRQGGKENYKGALQCRLPSSWATRNLSVALMQ